MIDTSLTTQQFRRHFWQTTQNARLGALLGQGWRSIEAPARSLGHNVSRPVGVRTVDARTVEIREALDALQAQYGAAVLPALPGWCMAGHLQPAEAVGGDFYDVLPLVNGRIGVLIGDVTGKGATAAVLMAMARSILRAEVATGAAPGLVLQRANDLIVERMPRGYFVTCLFAVIDLASGVMTLANAGHNLPFLATSTGNVQVEATGLPLGLMQDVDYEEISATVAAEATLVLYSDGISEARNTAREMFGVARLREIVTVQAVGAAPAHLMRGILDAVGGFTGGAQDDDIAVLVLRREI